ncbi:contractile injection system protein, VgrG/Pvc8 family [uncultured Herbaspirillum sp.]|uniref:contractile injection system protein, VgrG/Pvc8 family n=2 Tax=Herbaspirillum TaxID=963 RepID=UPI0032B1152F
MLHHARRQVEVASGRNAAEADRYAQLHLEASEARNKLWQARSTVRTLRPGTRFTLMQGPLGLSAASGKAPEYAVLSVVSAGVNNLPKDAQEGLAELFGPLPPLLEECLAACQSLQQTVQGSFQPDSVAVSERADLDAVIAQARKLGYANTLVEFVAAYQQRAREAGLDDIDRQTQYVLLALYTSGAGVEHPAVTALMQNPPASLTGYFDALQAMPEEVWEAGPPLWENEHVA